MKPARHLAPTIRLLALLTVVLLGVSTPTATRTHYLRTLVVEKNENLETAVCFLCNIEVRGQVAVAVTVLGGVEVFGSLTDTVVTCGGGVKLLSGGKAEGTLVAFGGPVEAPAGAALPKDIKQYPWVQLPGQRQFFWRAGFGLLGLMTTLNLVSYLLLRKRRAENVARTLGLRKVASFLIGLLLCAVILVVLVYSEDVGEWEDHLVLGALGAFCLMSLPGLSGVSLQIGRWMGMKSPTGLPVVLAGTAATTLLMWVPVIGVVVFVFVVFFSSGALILSRLGN